HVLGLRPHVEQHLCGRLKRALKYEFPVGRQGEGRFTLCAVNHRGFSFLVISEMYSSRRSKLSAQFRRSRSAHFAPSSIRCGLRRQGRRCASRPCTMSPAFCSTLMCFETPGRLICSGLASVFTVASPPASFSRIARRVGSASAASVALRRSVVPGLYFANQL